MGLSVYQNGGLIVIIVIVLGLWKNGMKLDVGVTMSLMAMVFYIFISVNFLFYLGLTFLQTFLAVVERVASIFELEEHQSDRNAEVSPDQVKIQMSSCDFSWGYKVSE